MMNLNNPSFNRIKREEKIKALVVKCSNCKCATTNKLLSDEGRTLCRACFEKFINNRK